MMQGPALAIGYINTYLASDLPTRLVSYREALDLTPKVFKDPQKYLNFETLAIDETPMIYTFATGQAGLSQTEVGEAGETSYRVRYAMRTYVWCKAESAVEASDHRYHLCTAVREALLDRQTFTVPSSLDECNAIIDEASLREEYSDVQLEKGDRWIAGALLTYDLTIEESITRGESLGVFLWATVAVDVMDKLPNAPTIVRALASGNDVTLTWRASSWDGGLYSIDGYRIEKSLDDGNNWSIVTVNTESTTPLFQIMDLAPGSYIFRVSAVNQAGYGETSLISNEVSIA